MFKIDERPHDISELDAILDEAMQEGKQTNNQNITYWKIVFAFDIETTSFTDKVTKTDHNEKRSIMYIWQLAINGRCIIGREWSEFLYVMNHIAEKLELSKYTRILCYIHNMAFEFAYIYKFFEWHKVFAIDKRKPIYGITASGIEFRCSYILTNYSLAKLGDQLHKYKVAKMVGDLDYSLIRTPLTPLSDKELQYCINDVLVVSAYIKEQIEKEKFIYKIPLTCTGYCRRYVRKKCLYGDVFRDWRKQFRNYHNFIKGLPLTYELYQQLHRAFQGGFTHSSIQWSILTINNVQHLDFTSSYPYVLLSEKFPMTAFKDIDASKISKAQFENYLKNYCCLFDCKLYNLKQKPDAESYIAIHKCFLKSGVIENNGRVYSASCVTMTLTEVDLQIINACYDFDHIEVSNMKISEKGYLPIEIIRSIIKLYKDKTELKGVKDKENEYLVSKGLLNSIYGMMVTDVVRDEIVFKDNEWSIENADPAKDIEKYNKSRRRFLWYPWGVWCTAYARRNLFYGILEFCNMGKGDKLAGDYIYADTDSIFCTNIEAHKDFIDRYNKLCEKKLRTMCDHYGLIYEDELLPKTIKGVTKPIGVWDREPDIQKFKTLGAKRYMTYIDGELSITVSGVNKTTAVPWLLKRTKKYNFKAYLKYKGYSFNYFFVNRHKTMKDFNKYCCELCFEAFEERLIVPEDATGKLTHYYIDKPYEGDITDYQGKHYHYYAPSGVYLEKATYCFDISNDYINFLKGVFYTK